MEPTADPPRQAVVLHPGGGRSYPMGRISAVFKADGEETGNRYSVSEWWLEPHTQGPGAHAHAEDDVFFVLEGTMTFLIDAEWADAPTGAFVLVPGGTRHDFENRGEVRAGGNRPGNPSCAQLISPSVPSDGAAVPGCRGRAASAAVRGRPSSRRTDRAR